MALESVDYSEDKACRILDIVIQEDKETKLKSSETTKKKDNVEKNVSFKEIRYLFQFLLYVSSNATLSKLLIICVEVQVCVTLLILTNINLNKKYNKKYCFAHQKTLNQILHAPIIN